MLIDISFTDFTNCQKTVCKAPGETGLADIKIKLKKRKLQEMEQELEIKHGTLRETGPGNPETRKRSEYFSARRKHNCNTVF